MKLRRAESAKGGRKSISEHENKDKYMSVISQFWDNTMEGIRQDLIILRGIQSPPHKTTCATATSMLCISTMEYIGYLIGDHKDTGDFKKSINKTLSREQKLFPACYWDPDVPLALCMLYRNEIMHHGFPAEWGIGKCHSCHDDYLFLFDGKNPSLNVNKLTDDLLKAMENLKERTSDEESALAKHMEIRIGELETEGRRIRNSKTPNIVRFLTKSMSKAIETLNEIPCDVNSLESTEFSAARPVTSRLI